MHCAACVHLSQLTRPTLYVSGFVFTCFGYLGPASASRGLCALVSVPWTHHLGLGACVHLFCLTSQPSMSQVLYALVSALQACPLSCEGCVCWRGLYAVPCSLPWAHPLHRATSVAFSQFPEPTICSGPQSVSCLWAEECGFFSFLPSKSLLCQFS